MMRMRHALTVGLLVAGVLWLRPPPARAQSPEQAMRGDVHDKAGVKCADCHKGERSAAAICASCHVLLAEKFKTSVHAQIFEKACVECHGDHGIKPPSEAMLGTSKPAVCASCHSDKDDPGFVAAKTMRASVDRLVHGIDTNAALIARVKNAGMEVGDQELALTEARTQLVLARTEMHAFDPARLDVVVSEGMKTLLGVTQGGNRALAELDYRRRGLFVSLVLILLFVGALGFKIRSLGGTPRKDSGKPAASEHAHTFVHDHYSLDAGESPTGHAAAILGGLVLMTAGLGLVYTVALLPVGLVVGLLGLFIFVAGVFGHIRSPLKPNDLMETIVSLAGMAVGLTFTLAIATFVVGFAVTVVMLLFGLVR
jgi:predicted CXXCH cytochrome family protein